MANTVQWATSSYLYNYRDVNCFHSFSTELDGHDGVYNPRFSCGKQITKAPTLTKFDVSLIVDSKSKFYDPWYQVVSYMPDKDAKGRCITVVVIKNKLDGSKTKWFKGNRSNSVWKKMK